MKDKILTLIIGILIGAIIATIGFFIYEKINENTKQSGIMQMSSGDKMQRPSDDGEEPPERPSGDNENQKMEKPNSNVTVNSTTNTI